MKPKKRKAAKRTTTKVERYAPTMVRLPTDLMAQVLAAVPGAPRATAIVVCLSRYMEGKTVGDAPAAS